MYIHARGGKELSCLVNPTSSIGVSVEPNPEVENSSHLEGLKAPTWGDCMMSIRGRQKNGQPVKYSLICHTHTLVAGRRMLILSWLVCCLATARRLLAAYPSTRSPLPGSDLTAISRLAYVRSLDPLCPSSLQRMRGRALCFNAKPEHPSQGQEPRHPKFPNRRPM